MANDLLKLRQEDFSSTDFASADFKTVPDYLLLRTDDQLILRVVGVGGLDIAIAAYHYNHNIGANV